MISVPVIETERLVLRGPLFADWEAMRDFGMSDRSVHIGGPFKEYEVWTTFLSVSGHWMMRGFGMWMIEHKASGLPAGRTGIINHIDWPEPELGWHVYEPFEGQGIAYEAALAARRYGSANFALPGPVISLIDPANARSRRLAERLGAIVEREGVVRGKPCLIYRHPKEAA